MSGIEKTIPNVVMIEIETEIEIGIGIGIGLVDAPAHDLPVQIGGAIMVGAELITAIEVVEEIAMPQNKFVEMLLNLNYMEYMMAKLVIFLISAAL